MSRTPRQSRASDGCGVSEGSVKNAYARATTPIGRLMRKIQCQLKWSMSQPPRIGPKIGPSSIGMPRTAMSRPIRFGPAARVMIVMPSGMSMPPPRPCRTRKATSISMLFALAHSTEPATKRPTASM